MHAKAPISSHFNLNPSPCLFLTQVRCQFRLSDSIELNGLYRPELDVVGPSTFEDHPLHHLRNALQDESDVM